MGPQPSAWRGLWHRAARQSRQLEQLLPRFLWWVETHCYAIDPTGAHILEDKIRGKLLTIDEPQILLITRGRVAKDWSTLEGDDGWTVARALAGRAPAPSYFTSLRDALIPLADAVLSASGS